MKVLLLTRYDRLGSTSRVRFLQYLPYLEASGLDRGLGGLLGLIRLAVLPPAVHAVPHHHRDDRGCGPYPTPPFPPRLGSVRIERWERNGRGEAAWTSLTCSHR